MIYIVYITTNLLTEQVYIGVHGQEEPYEFDGYLGTGVWRGRRRLGWKKSITEAIKEYGKANFKRKTLFYYWTEKEAYAKEAEIVTSEFVKYSWNYNLTPGGKRPPRLAGEDHPLYGKANSETTKRNLTNNPMSKLEARKKNSNTQQKYWSKHDSPQKGKIKPYVTERNLIDNPARRPGVAEKMSAARKGKPSPNKGKKGPPSPMKGIENLITKGTRFINNGVISKRINNDEFLPEGWSEHRLKYKRMSI